VRGSPDDRLRKFLNLVACYATEMQRLVNTSVILQVRAGIIIWYYYLAFSAAK
jgi:hypothetical protein